MGKNNVEQIKYAQSFLGKGGAIFRKYCGLPSGTAYCDAFVTYIFHKSGNADLFCGGKKQTYCPTTIKWCRANLAQIPPYLAMASDIVFFDWDGNGVPNHIGFVRAHKSTSVVLTTEGNTSGGIVANKSRATGYVEIFRPHFKGTYKIGILEVDGDCGYSTIANLQKALKMSFVDGILGKATVKALQKKAGCKSIDGAWGKETSRKVQALVGAKPIDGEFGPNSVKALQRWINRQNSTITKATPQKAGDKPIQAVSAAKGYNGSFPDLVLHSGQIIAYTGIALAYPIGTAKSKYTYGKGKATAAFTAAINKVYPNRSKWSKQCQAGASCDVGAGTVLRYSGYDMTIPRGLEEQIPHLQKSNLFKKTGLTKTSQMAAGDVGVYIHKKKGAHIWIGIGGKKIVEANHTAKYFLHVDTDNYTSGNKKVWGIFRACLPSAIKKGHKGSEVLKMQKFLNWFGGYKLAEDGGYGTKTEAAVKDFQKKVGVTADGAFGSASLVKAKACKK